MTVASIPYDGGGVEGVASEPNDRVHRCKAWRKEATKEKKPVEFSLRCGE